MHSGNPEIDIIIPSRFHDTILKSGFQGESENGAWLLFSNVCIGMDPWSKKPCQRYILREIHTFTENAILSASSVHLTLNTDSFIPVLKKASDGFIPGFLHGHPDGFSQFSTTDDENERILLQAIQNRNGKSSQLISLLVLPDGNMISRCWITANDCKSCGIKISGEKVRNFNVQQDSNNAQQKFDRQNRLFGESFSKTLQNLKVLVIGAGGTGSAISVMLARAGVGNIAIIDHDRIELSNLHRLHGANISDIGRPKAVSLAEYIYNIGFETSVIGICANILQPEYQDLLKSADVIFSATDDHSGRFLLNRFAYFYEIPVIDVGLAAVKSPSGQIKKLTGRLTIFYPGVACLLCRGIINSQRAREEDMGRLDQATFNKQIEEGYIQGGSEPEPAFISMTTSVATMAVEELIELICGFRMNDSNATQRFRRFEMPEDRCVTIDPKPECQICGMEDYWGLGDVIPFLDRTS